MRMRRMVTLLLGAWLGATVLMNWITVSSSALVEDVSGTSNAKAQIQINAAGPERARQLLAYQAAEEIRFYHKSWELFQLIFAILLFLMLLFATNGEKLVMLSAAGMLVIVLLQYLNLTPQIIEAGRAVDFTSAAEVVPERDTFYSYQRAYSVFEILKICLGLMVASRLTLSSREVRRKRKRKVVDEVDDANHGHVDG